jgi:hypothetical protein
VIEEAELPMSSGIGPAPQEVGRQGKNIHWLAGATRISSQAHGRDSTSLLIKTLITNAFGLIFSNVVMNQSAF